MSEEVESGLMTINVKMIGPCPPPWFTFQIKILENDTIKKLKTLITGKISHPEPLLTLCYCGKILGNDNETLDDLKIKENCTLFLVLRSTNTDKNKTEESQIQGQSGGNDEIQNQNQNQDGHDESSDENDENDDLSHREKVSIINQVTNHLFSQNLAKSSDFNLLILNSHPETRIILHGNPHLIHLIQENPKIFSLKLTQLEEMSLGQDTIKCIQSINEILERNPLGFGSDGINLQLEIRRILNQISDSKFLLNPWSWSDDNDNDMDMTPGLRQRVGKLILTCPMFQNMIKSPDFIDIMNTNHPNSTFDCDIFKQNVDQILKNPQDVLEKLEKMMDSKVPETNEDSDNEDYDYESDESEIDDGHIEQNYGRRLVSYSHHNSRVDFSSDEEEEYKVISNIEDYSGVRVKRSNASKSKVDSSDEETEGQDQDQVQVEEKFTEDPEKIEKTPEESDQNEAGETNKDTTLLILIDENIEESDNEDGDGDNDEHCNIGEKRKFSGDHDHDGNAQKLLKRGEESDEEESDSDDGGNQTTDVSSEEEPENDENVEKDENVLEPPSKKVKIEVSPPQELYSTQLSQLENFGFLDRDANIEVIAFTRGNINAAYEILIALGKRVSQIANANDAVLDVSTSSKQKSN